MEQQNTNTFPLVCAPPKHWQVNLSPENPLKLTITTIYPKQFQFTLPEDMEECQEQYFPKTFPITNPERFENEEAWNSPRCWEYAHRSRQVWVPLTPTIPAIVDARALLVMCVFFLAIILYLLQQLIYLLSSTFRYYDRRVQEINIHLEKLIIFRCHPEFKKTVDAYSKLNFTQMDQELWDYWVWKMSSQCPPSTETDSSLSYPDHGFKRHEEIQKVAWLNRLPPLNTPCWWRSKFIYRDQGFLFRVEVNNMTVVRNSWTSVCRVEFSYTCQNWNDEGAKWLWY
jgi:hypothetical protein